MLEIPNRATIAEVAARLRPLIRQTPVVRAERLSERFGVEVLLKLESEQLTGSFKIRGAWNRVRQLPADTRHVVAASSGNFASALAWAARERDLVMTAFIPEDMLGSRKVQAARDHGAAIETYRRGSGERDMLVAHFAAEHQATAIKSSDDLDVILGQGTATSEFVEQVGHLDTLLLPVAGGGLLAGAACVLGGDQSTTVIYGVEPVASNDMAQSLQSGVLTSVSLVAGASVADALLLEHPAPTCFDLCQRLLPADAGVVVTEDALCHALYLLDLDGVYAEPSAAAGVAALLSGLPLPQATTCVGVIVTGRNVDPEQHRAVCKRGRATRLA